MRKLSTMGTVSGIDPNPLAIRLAQKYLPKHSAHLLLVGGIHTLPELALPAVDCITCIDVLYHRTVRSWRRALQIMAHRLTPEGLLVLQVPAFACLKGSHDLAVDGVRRFHRAPVVRALEKNGFSILLCSYRFSWLFPGLLVVRSWERWRATQKARANDLSSMDFLPAWIRDSTHATMLRLAQLENEFILSGTSFPMGSSLFVVARKTAS
jgi:hypothetical protein